MTAFLIVLAISPAIVAGHLGPTIVCYTATQPVTIDGKWTSKSEWNDTGETQLFVGDGNGVGYFRVKHDGTWLFVLAESLINTAVEYNTTLGFGDYMAVFLDTLHNDGKSPATDDYRFIAGWVNASYTRIVTRKGTGTGWSDSGPVEEVQAKIGLDSGNSPHAPHPHVVGEFRIPLNIIAIGTFGFFIRFGDSSEVLTMAFYWPGPSLADQSVDPSSWGNVSYSNQSIPEFSDTLLVVALVLLSALAVFRFGKRRSRLFREQGS